MVLNNKTALALSIPFLIYGIVFFNSSFFTPLMESYVQNFSKDVNKKDFSYKKMYDYIDRNKDNFAAIANKTEENKITLWKNASRTFIPPEKSKGLITNVENDGKVPPLPPLMASLKINDSNVRLEEKVAQYNIQMTIPEDKMAIINNQIYYIGDENNGIILTRVDKKQACIQTSKGNQCIKIF